jgi:trk system potassium uptake protein TrkH
MKVIRHVLFLKTIWLELEHAYRPTVVRPLRLGGQVVENEEIRKDVLVYFGLVILIVVGSWMLLDVLEPDEHWSQLGHQRHEKLIDCASGIAATLNGVGPGLGVIGAVENYSHFQPASKLLFALLMLLGRLELFVVLVLFLPPFWRNR